MPLPTIPEYTSAICNPQLLKPAILKDGHPIEKGPRIIKYSGGFCAVFPYQTTNKKYAVRCWHAEVANAKKRTQIIANAIKNSNLPYFVGFDYYEDGIITSQGVQPIVVMDWVEAKSLKKYIAEHIRESETLNILADNFKAMVSDLHNHHFSHGDLQHGNIMVRQDKSLVLVDYDSMYVPELQGYEDEIKGLVGYQHEGRWKNKYSTEKADYFSELVIYLSLKALARYPALWEELNMEDTETMLFDATDIKSKGSSDIFSFLKQDGELSPLVDKLCEFLLKSSIDELEPLEASVMSKIDSISEKWKIRSSIPSKPKVEITNAEDIFSKWKTGNGHTPVSASQSNEKELNKISAKFKRIE